MLDWINESVAIYSSRSIAENIFRFVVFNCLMVIAVVYSIKLIKSTIEAIKKKLSLDEVMGIVLLAIFVLLSFVVAVLGIIVEFFIFNQML